MYTICKDFHLRYLSFIFLLSHSWTHVRNVSTLNDSFAYQKYIFITKFGVFFFLRLFPPRFLLSFDLWCLMMLFQEGFEGVQDFCFEVFSRSLFVWTEKKIFKVSMTAANCKWTENFLLIKNKNFKSVHFL